MPCKECYLPLYTIFAGQCEIIDVRKPQEFDIRAILRNKHYEPHQCSPELMLPCLDLLPQKLLPPKEFIPFLM